MYCGTLMQCGHTRKDVFSTVYSIVNARCKSSNGGRVTHLPGIVRGASMMIGSTTVLNLWKDVSYSCVYYVLPLPYSGRTYTEQELLYTRRSI